MSAPLIYSQMNLMGSNTVGFRNSDDEPWEKYRTPMHGAVISFSADKSGYSPQPEWKRLDGG